MDRISYQRNNTALIVEFVLLKLCSFARFNSLHNGITNNLL